MPGDVLQDEDVNNEMYFYNLVGWHVKYIQSILERLFCVSYITYYPVDKELHWRHHNILLSYKY